MTRRPALRLLPLFGAVLALLALADHPGRSLWLGETLTAWTTAGAWTTVPSRALHYQGQSAFFFLLTWPLRHLGTTSEVALRLPSMLAFVLSLPLVAMVGTRLVDREAGLGAAFLFAGAWPLLYGRLEARPYSVAVLAALAATWSLLRWTEAGERRWAACYVFGLLAAIYSHVLFAPMMVAHAVLLWARLDRPALTLKAVWAPAGILVFGLLPTFYQLSVIRGKWEVYAFAPQPGFGDLARAMFPGFVWVGLTVVGLLAVVTTPFAEWRWSWRRLDPRAALFFGAWLLLPPLLLFAVSHARGASVFVGRYYSWQFPAAALVVALAVHGFRAPALRLTAHTLLFGLILVAVLDRRQAPIEDWRGAIATQAPADEPVLVWTGLTETQVPAWVRDPEHRPYMLAPFQYYRTNAEPLPLSLHPAQDETRDFLTDAEWAHLKAAGSITVLVRLPEEVDGAREWARREGFRVSAVQEFGSLSRFHAARPANGDTDATSR